MVAITTRAGKGSLLTNEEIDANWNALVADLNTKMTQAQARAAISVSGSLTYNSTTGVLGFTETPLTSQNIVTALGFTPYNSSNPNGYISGINSGMVTTALGFTPYNSTNPNGYITANHNHDAAYLGKTAKAADSELLDGFNSTAFLRSVNGAGPDAAGNVAVNVDLSSRVAKSGDTMTGALTLPDMTVSSAAPSVGLADTSTGRTRKLYHNEDLMGFLKTDGNWDLYSNNNGQVWTANYGWLHDYFFSSVANCAYQWQATENCYNCGNRFRGYDIELIDQGASMRIRSVGRWDNCNCNCNCDCYCFPAGTMVLMNDGTTRRIESVALGDVLQSGLGERAIVAALHSVRLGSRKAYRVNGAVVTTGDHLFKTSEGWASLEPELYAALRHNKPSTVQAIGGVMSINASAISPDRVHHLTIGSRLLTANGEASVTSIEVIELPADTTLYSFMTEGACTFVADGFVVDGAPQEDI